MKLQTRDFGEIEIDEKDIFTFTGPIYGFESYRRFAFLYEEDIGEHFIWLQSVEEAGLCFFLVQPDLVSEHYAPELPEEASRLLGEGDYMCWLVASLREPFGKSTVNLKSPIVVNPKQHLAAQFVLQADLPIRHPLFRGEEDSTC